jgi:DNA repair exonuclease SbcCD ATPase subunit
MVPVHPQMLKQTHERLVSLETEIDSLRTRLQAAERERDEAREKHDVAAKRADRWRAELETAHDALTDADIPMFSAGLPDSGIAGSELPLAERVALIRDEHSDALSALSAERAAHAETKAELSEAFDRCSAFEDDYRSEKAQHAETRRALEEGKDAWRSLHNERTRLWTEAEARINAVRALLERNGCDCECGCDGDGHSADCDPCLACRISAEVTEDRNAPKPPDLCAEVRRALEVERAVIAEIGALDVCEGGPAGGWNVDTLREAWWADEDPSDDFGGWLIAEARRRIAERAQKGAV